MFREERDGMVSLKLYGDPDAVQTNDGRGWAYIHTLSKQAFELMIEEGIQLRMEMGLKQIMRETA